MALVSVAVLAGLVTMHPGAASAASTIQPDVDVVFDSAGIPVHASLRAPTAGATGVPGAVIIGGSGPIDRNGNAAAPATPLSPYSWMADRLSEHGVASIRYDKLGTGATGLGPYASDPSVLLGKSYDELRIQQARDALAFLARQPGVDPNRLFVIGHSEGGMVALALNHQPGNAPRPAGLALIEPQYAPILGIIDRQLEDTVTALVQQGEVTAGDGAVLVDWVRAGIAEIRTGTPPFPPPGPDPLPGVTGATARLQAGVRRTVFGSDPTEEVQTVAMRTRFGKEDDELDPVALAAFVTVPTLITCGERDTNTPCVPGGPAGSGVAALAAALPSSTTTVAVAPGTEHFLRDIGADHPTDAELAGYPYSAVIQNALGAFAASFVPTSSTTTTTSSTTVAPVVPSFTG